MLKRMLGLFCGILFALLIPIKIFPDNSTSETNPIVAVEYVRQALNSQETPSPVLLHLKNFPKNQEFHFFFYRPLFNQERYMEKVLHSDQEGNIILSPTLEKNILELIPTGFLPGEKALAIFQSKDQKTRVEVAFIPRLLSFESPDSNLAIGAQLIRINPTTYEIGISGLYDQEKFLMLTLSKEKKFTWSEFYYNPKLSLVVNPVLLGEEKGFVPLSIIARDQILSLQLPWGKAILEQNKIQ